MMTSLILPESGKIRASQADVSRTSENGCVLSSPLPTQLLQNKEFVSLNSDVSEGLHRY